MVRAAEEAEALVRQRVKVPSGVVRFTAAIGTAQFALREIVMNFMREYPRIDLVEHVTSRQVDLLAENIDVAIRAHSGALPDSTLVRRTLATAPWILVAGSEALKKRGSPQEPQDLEQFPSLAVWRSNISTAWRLRAQSRAQGGRGEVILPPLRQAAPSRWNASRAFEISAVGSSGMDSFTGGGTPLAH